MFSFSKKKKLEACKDLIRWVNNTHSQNALFDTVFFFSDIQDVAQYK